MSGFNKFSKVSILLFALFCATEQNGIQTIDSFAQAEAVLNVANQKTIVVFDIDDTLIIPVDAIAQKWFGLSPEGQQFNKILGQYVKTKNNPRQYWETMLEKIKSKTKFRLIEERAAPLIKRLQKRNVKVIALTNSETGAGMIIPSWQAWRFNGLKDVGVDLSSTFNVQEINLAQLIKSDRAPMYYKGILLADDVDKGIVLGAFLDVIHFVPDRIIFFDDQEKQVRSVEKMANARGIPFDGFVYMGVSKLAHTYDPAIVQLQLRYLMLDVYITEDQARQLLK